MSGRHTWPPAFAEDIAYVQKQFDDHARLNGREPDVEVFGKRGEIWWRGRHKITGSMIEGEWRGGTPRRAPLGIRRLHSL